VEEVKQHAYKNLIDLKPLPIDTTIHGMVETSASVQTAQYGGQDQALLQFDFPIAQQGTLYTYILHKHFWMHFKTEKVLSCLGDES
jgi:hypothetical protein